MLGYTTTTLLSLLKDAPTRDLAITQWAKSPKKAVY